MSGWTDWLGEKNKKGKEKGRKKRGKRPLKCIFLGYKLQKFSRGVFRPPLVPLHHSAAYLFVGGYIKNGEKGLKNASFRVINSKNFRGGVFRPPLHPPLPSGGASPRPPQTYSSGEKNDLKRGGGGMIELHNIYPCLEGYSSLPSYHLTVLSLLGRRLAVYLFM